jgi:hypothetical protein
MTSNLNRLARKALLLLFALGMMAAAAAVPPPAMACQILQCPFGMSWNRILCRCVCDCPNPDGTCGNCN